MTLDEHAKQNNNMFEILRFSHLLQYLAMAARQLTEPTSTSESTDIENTKMTKK